MQRRVLSGTLMMIAGVLFLVADFLGGTFDAVGAVCLVAAGLFLVQDRSSASSA